MRARAAWTSIVSVLAVFAALTAAAQSPDELLRELSDRQRELWREERFEEAEAVLLQMRSLAGAHDLRQVERSTVYNLACAAALRGQRELASERLRKAVALGFTSWRHIERDPDLESLRTGGDLAAIVAALREADRVTWWYEPRVPPVRHVYDPPETPQLATLVQRHGLGSAVAGAADDLDRAAALAGWTHRAFAHDGSRSPSEGQDDPLALVTAGAAGERFRCVEFAVVAAGAAQALGLPGRVVALAVEDVETTSSGAGHVVAEVWLPDRQSWVLLDGQFGVIPMVHGEPLSAVELRQALWTGEPVSCLGEGAGSCDDWLSWIYPYLYHLTVSEDQRIYGGGDGPGRRVMLVPAGAPHPRLFQGMEGPYAGLEYTSDPHVLYP